MKPLPPGGLAIIMIGAVVTHARRKASKTVAVNLVLLILTAVAAVGRFAFPL
jgi:hypothetical protein